MNLIGRVIAGRYEILEEIGSGGMAVVYKAKCNLLNRFVAVKVLRPDLQNDQEFVRRFKVEAQAAASLTHPNIVSIFDVGYEENLHYIVMEYVEGITLKDYIDEKHILHWREAVGYAVQIAKGLEQAHKNSIIHRDIKPHNIIMKHDGILKVTDFGIARANVQSTMTCEDTAIGSVHYISPEQARGGYTDERSDIYSLGVVLYEMLTGKVPFDSERPVAVAIMHLQDAPVPPREINLTIPLPLEKVVIKAMSKEVSGRYSTVTEMISELEAVLNDPTREVATEDSFKAEIPDTDKTIKMTAVKPEVIENEVVEDEVEPEMEEELEMKSVKHKPETTKINKKKEKQVIAVAIVSAVVIIAIIVAAFLSLSGIGGMIKEANTVEIPDIVGRSYDDAYQKYVAEADENAEYEVNIIKEYVESELDENTIIYQEPEAGEKVKIKDGIITIKVKLSEGRPEIVLKDYTKYSDTREIEQDLKKLGLKYREEETFSDDIPIGMIIRHIPGANETVKKGDTIVFYKSKGPEDTNDIGNNDQTTGNGGSTNPSENTDKPDNQGDDKIKKTRLTILGPRDKASALVQVKVNGVEQYSKVLKKDESDLLLLQGATDSVRVEIFFDGVSQGKRTVELK